MPRRRIRKKAGGKAWTTGRAIGESKALFVGKKLVEKKYDQGQHRIPRPKPLPPRVREKSDGEKNAEASHQLGEAIFGKTYFARLSEEFEAKAQAKVHLDKLYPTMRKNPYVEGFFTGTDPQTGKRKMFHVKYQGSTKTYEFKVYVKPSL